MSVKTKLLIAFLLFASVNRAIAFESSGADIKGTITTSDGESVANITVKIRENKRGTLTNEKGQYLLKNIKAGTYTLEVSAVGIVSQRKNITVTEGQTLVEDFVINLSAQQLQDVIVEGQRNRFASSSSDDVAKMSLKNLENPQVYSVVTGALMKEQVTTDYKQALNNIPGVMATTVGDGNGGTYVQMRGFYTTGGFRDGLASVQNAGSDPVNIEKVEAIKGPTGTLFGSTASYGGLINRVTKAPYDSVGGEISYFYGSNNLNRLTIDYNTPLNEDKTILFRLNGALHNENSFQDYGYKHNITIDPSFLFRLSDRLSVTLNTEIYNSRWTQSYYMGSYPETLTNIKDLPVGYKQSLTSNALETSISTISNYIKADYAISPHWKSVTAFSTMQNTWQPEYFLWYSWIGDSAYMRRISKTEHTTFNSIDAQQNFIGDFHIGSIRNRVVAGIDYYYYRQDMENYSMLVYDTITLPSTSVAPLSKARLDGLLAGMPLNTSSSSQNTLAVYASDIVNITDHLMAMASLRVDHYHNGVSVSGGVASRDNVFSQTALSPKFGLVYQPIKNQVSLFGSYSNAFTNEGPQTQPDGSISVFKPEHANQFEGGVKVDAANHKLSGSISYFNILVGNVIRLDNNVNKYIQDGSQRNAGVELDVKANPFKDFNIVAGYTYLKAKYLKTASDMEGKIPAYCPRNVANIWLDYKFVNGMGVAFGGNYVGKSFGNSSNTFIIPAYTVLNATVSYGYHHFRFALKVNNLGNVHYWDVNVLPQPLRQFVGNISYDF